MIKMTTKLTISHDYIAGTGLHGTSKGDGASDVVKALGWKWFGRERFWYIPRSRFRHADRSKIDQAKDALEATGKFEVVLALDDQAVSTAEVEEVRIEHETARAEALADRAGRLADVADTADKRAHALAELMPLGQPIVGIETRRAYDKIHAAQDKSFAAYTEAKDAREKAETAARTAASRYAVVTVGNRIETLEAEQRADERELAEHEAALNAIATATIAESTAPPLTTAYRDRLIQRMEERAGALEYWQGVRKEQQDQGIATAFSKATVIKGDLANIRGHWRKVVRVNAKSVSVETGYSWTDTAKWHEIRALRTADGRTVNVVDGQRVIEEPVNLEVGGHGDG